jgi:hypothetical protein
MKDGRSFTKRVNRHTMHGAAADPLSEQELKDKFRYCARLALPEGQVEKAVNAWWGLERAPKLTDALASVVPQ